MVEEINGADKLKKRVMNMIHNLMKNNKMKNINIF